MTAALWPTLIYAFVLLAHLIVPARWVDGYVRDRTTGRKLRYRLNGLRVLTLTVAVWVAVCVSGLFPWNAFYIHRWEMAAGACALGFVFTLAIVLPAPAQPGKSFFEDLYLGRWDNPQFGGGRLDAKMVLYLVGAVMLELNVLSFAAHHLELHPEDPSPGVFLYAAMFSFFVCEYLNFEQVHLYTYDFMAERVGFKLGWGCLVFYPFFYPVGLWATAEAPNPHTPTALLAFYCAVFFSGWALARGANLQKYQFKLDPDAKAFGILDPRKLTDGKRNVLTGGFWGLSRHINYLGEILMASGLALVLGNPLAIGPWLYPLYYVALLVPRQLDDDRRCAERYGHLWTQYCERVPWRIIPFVY
ncbi:MAG: protein-S-isoprenylcysteine O-methyltransferase Ste14 [Hyphomicrobiaceae bacterium]|jgi:protein-S-isoprenylcysteine O-methyltransferase Ste14